jgi:sulfur carrier protein ThiS
MPTIDLKCFATISKYQPENGRVETEPGETVAQVMERLGIPGDEVHIVFVNGMSSPPGTPLKDGDRVGLFPAVGGG